MTTAYRAFSKMNSVLLRVETFLMSSFTIALVVAIAVEVACRYLFFISTAWSEEIARYLFIWLTYIGSAYAVDVGGHIEIDVFQQILEKTVHKHKKEALKGLQAVSVLSTGVFMVIFGIIFWKYMMKVFVTIQTSPTMHIPMWIVYLPVFIGTVMGLFHCVHLLLGLIAKESDSQPAGEINTEKE